jgi:GTPase
VSAPFKAGFVVLIGRPNAGKSTLLNALLKRKLSIVSSKPQTTRHRILGILDGEGYQACLLDTPGFMPDPRDPLQGALRDTARQTAHDEPDVVVLLVEPGKPSAQDLEDFKKLSKGRAPVILAVNKADLPLAGKADEALAAYSAAIKHHAALKISALKGQGIEELRREIISRLPESPEPLYEPGHLSDRYERFFAGEIVREQVFERYTDEIPHATAVVVEQFREQQGFPDLVNVTLYVERDGQKGILIGERGRALNDLRARAKAHLEEFLGRPVELEIWIKVRKNWRKDPKSLKEFGYTD